MVHNCSYCPWFQSFIVVIVVKMSYSSATSWSTAADAMIQS